MCADGNVFAGEISAKNENSLLEHQFLAQTAGSPVCLARRNEAGHRLCAGNKMHGRTIPSARLASSWLSLGLSWGEIVQWRCHSLEKRTARCARVALCTSCRCRREGCRRENREF